MENYGILSLLPVALILIIAVATRRTLFAMTIGLCTAALVLGGFTGFLDSLFTAVYNGMGNETLQWLILVIAMFGILIALFEQSGAVVDFGKWTSKFVKTKKQSLFVTFILGIVVFIDDYLNNLAVGTTMKGITDQHKIPRTQLGYVVNSVAAPVCVLIPMSSWAVYFGGLFEENGITANGSGMGAYIQAIPFTFYGWIAVIVVILQISGVIPKLGTMKKDYIRAEETGNVFPAGTEPAVIVSEEVQDMNDEIKEIEEITTGSKPQPWNFLVPLIVMIAVTLLTDIDVLVGSIAGVVTAFLLYLIQRKMGFKDLLTACFDGVISMGFVLCLSVLAFSVQDANTTLGLADYVISLVLPVMKGAFLPMVVFLVCAVYAYATGCFWDLAVIILPIVIPLAQAMGVDPILAGAAVFSGAAFGSNTCLYGDGVILCSQAVGIKSVDLMLATLPYASIAGGISAVLYLIAGFVFA